MVTLQEYLNKKCPTKEIRQKIKEIMVLPFFGKEINPKLAEFAKNGETRPLEEMLVFPDDEGLEESPLDLSDFTSLEIITLGGFDLPGENIRLTSVDFLNTIPNPEKIRVIDVNSNNIKPTDISIFSRFVNVRSMSLGTAGPSLTCRNRFYGSLKSYQNLTKLESICIEATDVNEGLEYLPTSLVISVSRAKKSWLHKSDVEARYKRFECSPHGQEVGCKIIQNQLRRFDYDIEAWQLSHPAEMFRAKPELFASGDSKEKWLNAISNKIGKTQEKLKEIQKVSPNKIKKIKRLNTKLGELNVIKQLLEERDIFEDSLTQGVRWYEKFKEDKATQTETRDQDQETQAEELMEYKMPGAWPKS